MIHSMFMTYMNDLRAMRSGAVRRANKRNGSNREILKNGAGGTDIKVFDHNRQTGEFWRMIHYCLVIYKRNVLLLLDCSN